MSNSNLEFHVVPLADRTTRSIMLAVLDGVDENREHLVKHLGDRTAQMVIDLMTQQHVSGKYKEFNLLRGDRDRHGLDWILLMGLGKKKDMQQDFRLHDRVVRSLRSPRGISGASTSTPSPWTTSRTSAWLRRLPAV